jgi:hypothetical protein
MFMVIVPNHRDLPRPMYYTCIMSRGMPFKGNLRPCDETTFDQSEYVGNIGDIGAKLHGTS